MKKKEIENIYLKEIKKLNEHSKNYYEKSNPTILDADFDKLKIKILELEKRYTFLKNYNSPSKTVGFKPSKSFQKINVCQMI